VDTLPPGERRVTNEGSPGKRQVTEKATYHNGREVARERLNSVVIQKAIPRRLMEGRRAPGTPPASTPTPATSPG